MTNFERTLRRRRKIFAGVVTTLVLVAAIAVVWLIATVVNIKKGVDPTVIGSTTPSAAPSQMVELTPTPTETPEPTHEPTFAETLAEQVKAHDKVPVIMIDPGHGFNSEGAMADGSKGVYSGAYVDGVWEDAINLAIGLKLRDILEAAGCTVLMTRDGDACTQAGSGNSADLKARRNMANESDADAFISIHQNSMSDSTVNGTQVWTNTLGNEYSYDLGTILLRTVTEACGSKALQCVDEAYKGINDGLAIPKANKPTALVECGYMTNAEELKNLTDDEYQEKIAEGLATGIFEFFSTYTIWK